jgi:HEAT repeat protein
MKCLGLVTASAVCFSCLTLGAGETQNGAFPGNALNTLSSPDIKVRIATVSKLRNTARDLRVVVQALALALMDPEAEVRYSAAEALADVGPSAYLATNALAASLWDPSPRVRAAAADALFQIGPRADSAVPDLVAATADKDVLVRIKALDALGAVRARPDEVVPALVKGLKDPAPAPSEQTVSPRVAAASSLGLFGEQARDAAPALLEAARGSDDEIRGPAMMALGKVRSKLETVIPFLRAVLNDPNQQRFWGSAAIGLGEAGPGAADSVADLLRAFSFDGYANEGLKSGTRQNILYALWKLHQTEVLVRIGQDEKLDLTSRRVAINGLAQIGPAAKDAIPFLVRCLKDEQEPKLYTAVYSALKGIGKGAVKPLIGSLSVASLSEKERIVLALGMIGPPASEALPYLDELKSDPHLRSTAIIASERIRRWR